MSSTQKNGRWHFVMKAHIGVDSDSGLVHTVRASTTGVHDSQLLAELTHGHEQAICGDALYSNQLLKANCRQAGVAYLINDKASRHHALSAKQRRRNRRNSGLRAKVEFPFRIIKHLWGHATVRYKGFAKNAARLHLPFALSNLYQARKILLSAV